MLSLLIDDLLMLETSQKLDDVLFSALLHGLKASLLPCHRWNQLGGGMYTNLVSAVEPGSRTLSNHLRIDEP